jgi:hypothetical protein
MNNSFERALPENYKEVKYVNAKSVKFGLISNLIALIVWFFITALLLIPLILNGAFDNIEPSYELMFKVFIFGVLFLIGNILYMVLHELTHGAVYKAMTKKRLTYGISWSCAYCGVPKLYVYRKTALLAILAPLILFSIIFGAMTLVCYFVSPLFYLLFATLFALHLGACAGDIYVAALLIFKFRDKRALIRDTGPEQFFYIPAEGDI